MEGKIRFSDAELRDSIARKVWKKGLYELQVIKASVNINEENGNMTLVQECAVLDDQGNVRRPTIRRYFDMPFQTPPEDLKAKNLPSDIQAGIPDTADRWRSYVIATRPDAAPRFPKFVKDTTGEGNHTWVDEDGNTVATNQADADRLKGEAMRPVLEFGASVCETPDLTVGDRFFADVYYKEGSDFAKLKNIRGSIKETDVLSDVAHGLVSVGKQELG